MYDHITNFPWILLYRLFLCTINKTLKKLKRSFEKRHRVAFVKIKRFSSITASSSPTWFLSVICVLKGVRYVSLLNSTVEFRSLVFVGLRDSSTQAIFFYNIQSYIF